MKSGKRLLLSVIIFLCIFIQQTILPVCHADNIGTVYYPHLMILDKSNKISGKGFQYEGMKVTITIDGTEGGKKLQWVTYTDANGRFEKNCYLSKNSKFVGAGQNKLRFKVDVIYYKPNHVYPIKGSTGWITVPYGLRALAQPKKPRYNLFEQRDGSDYTNSIPNAFSNADGYLKTRDKHRTGGYNDTKLPRLDSYEKEKDRSRSDSIISEKPNIPYDIEEYS